MLHRGSPGADQPGKETVLEAIAEQLSLVACIPPVFKQRSRGEVSRELAFRIKMALLFLVENGDSFGIRE